MKSSERIRGLLQARRLLRGTELMLWMIAALCLSVCAFAGLEAYASFRTARGQAGGQQGAGSSSAVPAESSSSRTGVENAGAVIGRLEIPELQLSVPMTAGIESRSLLRGVGHIEGTAQPGGLGTLGLAGHRDTYFRPLRGIAKGMDIRVVDQTGAYHYQVDSTEIVLPEQVEVLAIRDRPELTLVTCFPFDYVGAAPKRFIVHAHLLSAAAELRNH